MTRSTDELMFHMPAVAARAGRTWERNFARSIQRQSRSAGWNPSPKQESIMQQLVAEMFAFSAMDGGKAKVTAS